MATIDFRADLLRALELRLEMYAAATEEGIDMVQDVVRTETMKRAEASPRWVHVADYIDTWDENDRYWIGVREPQMISVAQAAEYGTDEYPPEPLMRTLDSATRMAYARANYHIAGKFGGGIGI